MTSQLPRRFAAAALCVALMAALGACRQEQPAPADTPQAAAEVPAEAATAPAMQPAEPAKIAGTDAIAVSQNTSADAATQGAAQKIAGTDAKDFAGRFAAGSDALQLNADGTYTMAQDTGTWTVEGDGKTLLLDSNDKAATDRRYAVVSRDELRASEGGAVLRRDGAR
jgi:hypothetical protein